MAYFGTAQKIFLSDNNKHFFYFVFFTAKGNNEKIKDNLDFLQSSKLIILHKFLTNMTKTIRHENLKMKQKYIFYEMKLSPIEMKLVLRSKQESLYEHSIFLLTLPFSSSFSTSRFLYVCKSPEILQK